MKTKLAVFAEKFIEAGWLAAVIAVPLYFNIYSARTFEPDKITLLRSIALVMSLAWIVIMIEQVRGNSSSETPLTWPERVRLWLKKPLALPTSLLVLVYLISTLFSISPWVSVWGSYQRLQGTYSALSYIVIFALIAGYLRTRAQVDRLVAAIIITSIPVSLYGIVQRYGLDPLPWAGDVTSRVASTMGNAIFVASYLIMIIPLTISRLIESMTAIIKEEEASWGHTILSAVYIFALAIQVLTVIFSGSRGPMLGVLGASFVMGLLVVLTLRQLDEDSSRLSLKEVGSGIAFVFPIALVSALGGLAGYLFGRGLEGLLTLLNYQVEIVPMLGAALGVILGFLGIYTYMAAAKKGWRWLWLSWFSIAIFAIIFVLALNLRGTGLDPYLDPVRRLPGLDRLSNVTETESGTGRVRVLIWDAALQLVVPHEPLGVAGDDIVGQDRFNFLRPLIGYGPESMFNAFAFVYPPELAHVEARGSSADRSHNETVDSLVITGFLGFLIFYTLMVSIFYYILTWLGWASDKAAKRRLIIFLAGGSLLGAGVAYLSDGGDLTYIPLGLPFGLIFLGAVPYLIWQATGAQKIGSRITSPHLTLLLIGVLGAIIGHFIEVHFVFSIASTYTYFWVYAGLIVALARIGFSETEPTPAAETDEEATEAQAEATLPERQTGPKRGRKARRRAKKTVSLGVGAGGSQGENWEVWLSGQGLVMSIILMIITFDFITPQFQFTIGDQDSMSLLWMFLITWLIGLAIALSDIAIREGQWQTQVNWVLAAFLYPLTSLVYFGFYYLAQRIQFGQRVTVTALSDVLKAADVLVNGMVVFYIFLFLLLLLFALLLSWRQTRGAFMGKLWGLQLGFIFIIAPLAVWYFIGLKNIDVVKADIYLKEGNRYRDGRQWDQAIILHDTARAIDNDEDFYYLMLALDYQLMAQDPTLDATTQKDAWRKGEEIALTARAINPYNPDNTGNMGRYYFTIGQVFDNKRFEDALAFFEKATILAPSNVIYHNLWAQTYYILQDYQAAIARLQTSIEIDPEYPPTWALLGDTYAAMGNVDKALEAHSQAMRLNVSGSDGFSVFADQFLDQRLGFYISADRLEDIIEAMKTVAAERPDNERIPATIARTYILAGQPEQAKTYLEQAVTLGDNSNQTLKELANNYLTTNQFELALPLYQFIEQNTTTPDIETFSALGYIYAQQGNLDEAIRYNQLVIDNAPNDYDSLKNLALLHQQKGEFQEALSAAKRAKEMAPEAEAASWDQFITQLETQLADAS
jgi:tetratricopeptide (TPR) repeat protein